MGRTLATMLTITTYGTWLRGDARGWVDRGIIFPADPELEARDRARMKRPEFRFRSEDWWQVGQWMGESLTARLAVPIWAMTVQPWHTHLVVGATAHPLSEVVKCAKDAVRWGLRAGRPIWGNGYDKRFCYSATAVRARIEYVERHNLAARRPAKPWAFIVAPGVFTGGEM